jgi:hypothetical protein
MLWSYCTVLRDDGWARTVWRSKHGKRLFHCNPGCRDPLAALVISTDLYRRARQCLAGAHRRLAGGLCTMDVAAREALFQTQEGEMLAILDVLDPLKLKEGKPTCAPG